MCSGPSASTGPRVMSLSAHQSSLKFQLAMSALPKSGHRPVEHPHARCAARRGPGVIDQGRERGFEITPDGSSVIERGALGVFAFVGVIDRRDERKRRGIGRGRGPGRAERAHRPTHSIKRAPRRVGIGSSGRSPCRGRPGSPDMSMIACFARRHEASERRLGV